MAQKSLILMVCFLLLMLASAECSDSDLLEKNEERLLLNYARLSITAKLHGETFTPNIVRGSRFPQIRKAVFVTLEKEGKVRGCRGSLEPVGKNIAEDVCRMAVAASMGDKRFQPLTKAGLKKSRISITVVNELIPYKGGAVDKRDGIVYRKDGTAGIVLPYEGSDTFTRIGWAYLKAGMTAPASPENVNYNELYIMKADRFAEGDL